MFTYDHSRRPNVIIQKWQHASLYPSDSDFYWLDEYPTLLFEKWQFQPSHWDFITDHNHLLISPQHGNHVFWFSISRPHLITLLTDMRDHHTEWYIETFSIAHHFLWFHDIDTSSYIASPERQNNKKLFQAFEQSFRSAALLTSVEINS